MEKDMKAQLGRTLMGTRGSVPSLLKGWLLTFPNGMALTLQHDQLH